MDIDPRLFGGSLNGQPARAHQMADIQARAEIEQVKQFLRTRVGGDIQLLSKALADLNQFVEHSVRELAARIVQIEAMLSGNVGPVPSQPGNGQVVEAANVRPGDENLPLQYFEGEDSGP